MDQQFCSFMQRQARLDPLLARTGDLLETGEALPLILRLRPGDALLTGGLQEHLPSEDNPV